MIMSVYEFESFIGIGKNYLKKTLERETIFLLTCLWPMLHTQWDIRQTLLVR